MKLFLASLAVQWLRIRLAVQVHQFDPWSRKIPHDAGQLSVCITSIEPVFQSLGATATAHEP